MAENPPACAWCKRPSHIRQGRILLCVVHYRMSTMRSSARRNGKVVPSYAEIETLIPSPFTCVGCDREMIWLRAEEASRQVTLQHDRSGRLRLLCLGCNTRHSTHPGDTFYDIPTGHKRCPDCEKVMPVASFAVDRSRPIGRKAYCRACSAIRHKNWSNRNAA